jgi:hypothetical protein
MVPNTIKLKSGWSDILTSYDAQHLTEIRLKARLAGEGNARQMLEQNLGAFSGGDIRLFLKSLNSDRWGDKERHNRFMPAFYGHLANQIVECQEAFNSWSKRLWETPEDQIEGVLDGFWERNEVSGAGTSLPTAILYLRDAEKYAIWIPAMDEGFRLVTSSKQGKRRTSDGYRIYNDGVQTIRTELGLKPQTMDIVLTLAGKMHSEEDFEALFREFLSSHVESQEGQTHLKRYPTNRQEGSANFRSIREAANRGEDVTDRVLLKLLPHADTTNNRKRNAWIHVAPSITKDVKQWFEGAGWVRAEDWSGVAKAVLGFIEKCEASPEALSNHCSWFIENCPAKGFQMGMLTPILNALNPESFCIVNQLKLNYREVLKTLVEKEKNKCAHR